MNPYLCGRILKEPTENTGLFDDYLVEFKDSVDRETPLEETDFDGGCRISFIFKGDVEVWVTERNL